MFEVQFVFVACRVPTVVCLSSVACCFSCDCLTRVWLGLCVIVHMCVVFFSYDMPGDLHWRVRPERTQQQCVLCVVS